MDTYSQNTSISKLSGYAEWVYGFLSRQDAQVKTFILSWSTAFSWSQVLFCFILSLILLFVVCEALDQSWASVHERSAALGWHVGYNWPFWSGPFFWQTLQLGWVSGLPHLIMVSTGGKGRFCDPWGMQVKGCKWHRSWMSSPPVYTWLSAICSLLIPAVYLQFWTTGFLMLHIFPADISSFNPERKCLGSFFARNNHLDFFIFPFTSNTDVDWRCKSKLDCCKLRPELH